MRELVPRYQIGSDAKQKPRPLANQYYPFTRIRAIRSAMYPIHRGHALNIQQTFPPFAIWDFTVSHVECPRHTIEACKVSDLSPDASTISTIINKHLSLIIL